MCELIRILRKATEIKSSEVAKYRYMDKQDKGLQIASLVKLLKDKQNQKDTELETDVTDTIKMEMGQNQNLNKNKAQKHDTIPDSQTVEANRIKTDIVECKTPDQDVTKDQEKKGICNEKKVN